MMLNKLDKVSIRNILSIRYNPLEKSLIPPLTWKNCKNKISDEDGLYAEKLLKNIIAKSLTEHNSIAISLSAGIDSTLCLALLRDVLPQKKIIALCGVFEDSFDESKIAATIASKFDADFHTVQMDSMFTQMPEIISIAKKPKWNTYTHLIAKSAKKFTKTLVTGDGADELFGGYTFRYQKFLNLHRPKDNWKIKTINYLECHNRDWVPDQQDLFGNRIKFDWDAMYSYFKEFFSNPLTPLEQVMLADFNGKLLHDFIPTSHNIFEHYGLDGVQIFLDPDMVSYAMNIPISQKYDQINQKGKLILRKITSRLGVKHMNEKRGFSPSLLFDWKKHGREICRTYLLERKSHIFKNNLINHNWVIRAFERVENDGDIRYLNRLISILALEIWYRIFITKEIKSTEKL